MVFKCKMCGGTLEFEQGATVGVCDSCGTRQTLPRLDDDKRANLYDRANHFRRSNDYDKAAAIYDQILNEDKTDAEAYWSLVLCRYGIEYVEDPKTHRQVPTVNRAQYTSIYADEDYKSAIQYADGAQRAVYEEEAAAIDEIQKGILEISQKEEPFDVFICYKETDNNGRRTQDSVLANDLYHQLTQEGFKVFFSRITLEDKLGTAYEPYIFAALNSARVMVVLGTKPEYFNAVWVKNEWSRYLALIKGGAKKMLIPAYRDMDPYDLPEEFSHLQAQDMSKLGFMQDLIRGIRKILGAEGAEKTREHGSVHEAERTGGAESLLKRVSLFLEDGDWSSADEYCERVLDADPENAEAYLGKLMAQVRARRRDRLADCTEPIEENQNYQKALRFADGRLRAELEEIREKRAQNRLEAVYVRASQAGEEAKTPEEYEQAAQLFESISGWKDAAEQAVRYREKGETLRKDIVYADAAQTMEGAKTPEEYEQAAQLFESISGWKDAAEQAVRYHEKGEICRKDRIYDEAVQKMLRDTLLELEKAIQLFESIPDWKDAEQKQEECRARIRKKKAVAKRGRKICIAAALVCLLLIGAVIGGRALHSAVVNSVYDKAEEAIKSGDYQKFGDMYRRLIRIMPDTDHWMYSSLSEDIAYEVNDLLEAGDAETASEVLQLFDLVPYDESDYMRARAFVYWIDYEADMAEQKFEAGEYEEALKIYHAMQEDIQENDPDNSHKEDKSKLALYALSRGNEKDFADRLNLEDGIYTFGAYEQDGDLENGAEPIEWKILDWHTGEEGVELYLASRYILDYQPFALDLKGWERYWTDSYLYQWLNDSFYNTAFGEEEKKMLAEQEGNGDGKVSLMHQEEVKEKWKLRSAEATPYAHGQKTDGTMSSAWCRFDVENSGFDDYYGYGWAPNEEGNIWMVSSCVFPQNLEDVYEVDVGELYDWEEKGYAEDSFWRQELNLFTLTGETGVSLKSFVWSDEYGGYYSSGLGGVRPCIHILIPIE